MKLSTHQAIQVGCLLAICLPVAQLSAQTFDDEIVVVSTRTPVAAATLGTSFSVLTEQDIKDQGYDSLADHLATQVGVSVNRNGGIGSVTTVRIRGEEGYRTKLFIDGMQISDPSAPQVSPLFDNVTSTAIDRVEVLRGPQGMVYGGDSGGVISVYSRNFEDGFGGSIGAKVGSDGFQRANAVIGGGNDSGQVGLLASALKTDGINAYAGDTNGEDDDYDNATVHLKGQLDFGQGWSLSAVARDETSEAEYDNCGFLTPDHNCESESDFQAGLVALDYNSEATRQRLSIGLTDTQRDFFQSGVNTFGVEGEITHGVYLGQVSVHETLDVIYGVDYEQQETSDDEGSQVGYHAAIAHQWQKLNYHIGARLDDNEDFDDVTSYKASANYGLYETAESKVQLKISYGTGFRLPSLFEFEYNQQFAPATAPDLTEEFSEGLDVGVQWLAHNGKRLAVTWFKQNIEDEIVFDLTTFSYAQANGESEATGVEMELDWPLSPKLSASWNYIYLDTETITGDVRARRPKHEANLGLLFTPTNQVRLRVNARVVRDVEDIYGSALDDYTLVDAKASYQALETLELYASVNNLLDDDYQQATNFNTPGREAFVGIEWQF